MMKGMPGRRMGSFRTSTLPGLSGMPTPSWRKPSGRRTAQTGDVEQGCMAARAFAEAHADEVVTPLYFGYANRTLSPADLCPVEPA